MFFQGITLPPSFAAVSHLPDDLKAMAGDETAVADDMPVEDSAVHDETTVIGDDLAVDESAVIDESAVSEETLMADDMPVEDSAVHSETTVIGDDLAMDESAVNIPAYAAAVSNLPADTMARDKNESILGDKYFNIEYLGDGSCVIYAREGVDVLDAVDSHGKDVDDLASSDHLGICEHNGCHEEVYIACPTCLNFLCYDHKDSTCECHTSNIPDIDTHVSSEAGSHYVIVVDDATGAEFKVPIINVDQCEMSNRNGNVVLETDGEMHNEDNGDVSSGDDTVIINAASVNGDSVRSRKRVRRKISHPESWGRNAAKSSHLKGHEYKKSRGISGSATVPPKSVQPCNCTKCRYKCSENFSDDARQQIFEQFYELADYCRQKDFIINHVVEMPTKTETKHSESHRQVSRAFYLPNNGKRMRVCGNFFCKTLDIKIRSLQKYFTVHRGSIGLGCVIDGRGRHTPPNKTADWKLNLIRKHIESFPTMESHYCRADSTRLYLDSKLTIRKMYTAFVSFFRENLPPLVTLANGSVKQDVSVPSEKTYRTVFCCEYNLSFYVPRKDQCAVCARRNYIGDDTEKMAAYEEHIRQKNRAEAEKKADKAKSRTDDKFAMCTFDMQSILQLPVSEIGPMYYKRKLTLHNITIYESTTSTKSNAFCYIWPETDGNRGANEIGTCIFNYLQCLDKNIEHVTLYSDCCAGQNRNQYVCSVLMHAVRVLPVKIIDQKFLIPGHTMMECDSMHSAIEFSQRHLSIYSVHEWVNVIHLARKQNPYKVRVMSFSDFKDLKALASKVVTNRRTFSTGTCNWLQIRWLRVEKQSPNQILFKTDFDQESFHVLSQSKRKKWIKAELKNAYKNKLPISSAKYNDLMSMLKNNDIPEQYSDFYTKLPHDRKVKNLLPEVSDDE